METNKYPKTYNVSVYKTDFEGRSTGEVSYRYIETVNNEDEQIKFWESFDGGNYANVTEIK